MPTFCWHIDSAHLWGKAIHRKNVQALHQNFEQSLSQILGWEVNYSTENKNTWECWIKGHAWWPYFTTQKAKFRKRIFDCKSGQKTHRKRHLQEISKWWKLKKNTREKNCHNNDHLVFYHLLFYMTSYICKSLGQKYGSIHLWPVEYVSVEGE